MDQDERQKYEEKSKQLRAELKQFEADWASRNAGNKPRREDIKQNPDIARKYKKYNQVRDILAGKIPPPQAKKVPTPGKRMPEEGLAQTPSKRQKSVETPSHLRERIIDPEMFETPSTRKLFSPALPTSIGPTPQRDGRVLGLFDLMEENDENTPSKSGNGESLENFNVQATPSKTTGGMSHSDIMKLGRTPTSTSKRGMLFTTPSKPRDSNAALGRTPTSTSKLQLSTPSFLRRVPLATVDENGNYVSPAPIRLPPKPLGRTLSSVVASLRKLEEEALDDDLEALHEIENDRSLANGTKPIKPNEKILEPDSQVQQLLGGFDNEALYDSPPEEELGRDGRPLKVYKKKGQKRSTRRVNIKPTKSKRPEKPAEGHAESDAEDDVVLETQIDATKGSSDPIDLGSDSEFDPPDEGEEEVKGKSQAKKTKKVEKKGGKIQKAVKKVNELAHANFKRLKLKNHGAKGSGINNKFRRRR
ncbi:DNA replication/checkpoint protein [Hypomontagnella submonticulosa]|nr:DNA replication/checkpoint protein [Hypomontagnella submonticulosa]